MIDAMSRSALESAQMAEDYGLPADHIILSAKLSGVQDLIEVYRALAARCDYALHLGLTEAGMGAKGIVASTAALAVLLQEGIGDTIRVSLTPAPGGDRAEEVRVAQQILQSLEIRSFLPQVSACPGCGRTSSSLFPGNGGSSPDLYQDPDARVEEAVSRHRRTEDCRHGLCCQRSRESPSTPTSAFLFPGQGRIRKRRFTSTADWQPFCAGKTSSRNLSPSSRTMLLLTTLPSGEGFAIIRVSV